MSAIIQANVDSFGNVVRVSVNGKPYDVARIPSAIPGVADTIKLIDQVTKNPFLPSQLGVSMDMLKSVESLAKVNVDLSSPSQVAKATEMNIKAGDSPTVAAAKAVATTNSIAPSTTTATVLDSATSTFTTATRSSVNKAPKTEDFRVKLVSTIDSRDFVEFLVSPTIDESRSASYDQLNPIHHPGAMQVYRSSAARIFNINGKLIARNKEEATRNIKYMNLIRSWVMPYYGTGTAKSSPKMLGAPPDVLRLTAYGAKNIHNIPVVVNSYNWTYPDQVDYVPAEGGVPCPVMMDVSIAMTETYSPVEFGKFDLIKFKNGIL